MRTEKEIYQAIKTSRDIVSKAFGVKNSKWALSAFEIVLTHILEEGVS